MGNRSYLKLIFVSVAILIGSFAFAQSGGVKYVSPQGSDSNDGSKANPFKTVQKAVSVDAEQIKLLSGTYYEHVQIDNLKRTATNPLIISADEQGTVLFEGVKTFTYNWQPYADNNNIYVSDVPEDIWQLFVDGSMMLNARWPNADNPFEDFDNSSWWDRYKSWCKADGDYSGFEKTDNTTYRGWLRENGAQNMAATGIDFNGKVAVLNVNSMETYAGIIKNHTAGTNDFEYELHPDVISGINDKVAGVIHKNRVHAYFFFENGLDLLDVPGEWYYDKTAKKVYIYPPEGVDINSVEVRAKTQDYAFEVTNSEYVYLKGVNFFGTTVKFEEIKFSKIEDCNFMYASYSKRILDDIDEIEHTQMVMLTKPDKDNPQSNPPTGNLFINNEVAFTDGMAFHMTRGIYDTIYNNYFHHIDISGTRGGSIGVDYRGGFYTAFIRNTFEKGGASAATKSANYPYNKLNRLSQWGYIQDDGVAFQVANGGQIGSISTQNWIHNSIKAGLRFDGPEDTDPMIRKVMIEGTFVRNVVWNNPLGYMVKGDHHRVYNNVAFNNSATGAKILGSTYHENGNTHTVTRNNVMEDMSGTRDGTQYTDPVPGIVDHNWLSNLLENNIKKVLRDPDNFDFRPKEGSELVDRGAEIPAENLPVTGTPIPDFTTEFKVGDSVDMGAYEYGCTNYWIPGRMQPVASTPIPPNGTTTAMTDVDLMWLKAYKSTNNRVYFGESANNMEMVAEQANNIYNPGDLNSSKEYFWRVDCFVNGEWKKGEVWSFIPNGKAYKECGIRSSVSYEFSTPNGMEDYNSVPFKHDASFAGEIHLLSDKLLIMTDAPKDSAIWNGNGFRATVNAKVRPYPFIAFEYYAPDRETDFDYAVQIMNSGKKTPRSKSKNTLTPSQDGFKTAIINISSIIDAWDEKYSADFDWHYLELLHMTVSPEGGWVYAEDGDLWMDNFHVGFKAIKDSLKSPKVVGQNDITMKSTGAYALSYDDLQIEATFDGGSYAWPLCEAGNPDWELVIGEGENYVLLNGNIVTDSDFGGELSIPVKITATDYESEVFQVKINVENKQGSDASLIDLLYDKTSVEGFNAAIFDYSVELPNATETIPVVSYQVSDTNSFVDIMQATELPGTAIVKVTSQDSLVVNSYTLSFIVADALSADATLKSISINNVLISDFSNNVFTYTNELPFGTTEIPQVSGETTDVKAVVNVKQAEQLPGSATITVTAEDTITILEYTVNFTIATEDTYTVTFEVKNKDAEPVEGLSVNFNDDIKETTASGIALFENVSNMNQSPFSITGSESYKVYNDYVSVDGDNVEVQVVLEDVEQTSINEKKEALNFYPNPANQVIYLPNYNEITSLSVCDLQGKVLMKIDNPELEVNISELEKGIYIIIAKNSAGLTWVDRLILE